MARFVIGVDLGGTNVRAALVDRAGTIVGEPLQQPSRAQEGFPATLDAIVRTIEGAIQSAGVEKREIGAVGMAVPGHIDSIRGMVRWAPNFGEWRDGLFHEWREVPLGDAVQQRTGLPVCMGNDANLAALGEYYYGTGRGRAKGLVMLTLGTGIGGGVVLSQEQVQGNARWQGGVLLVGAGGGAGELGHTIVLMGGPRCGCGATGCIEALARRDAIIERAREKSHRAPGCLLMQLCEGDPSRITPKLVADACEQGDPIAREVWEETGYYIGVAVASFINIFNPEVVAIGGQIAKAGAVLFDAIRRAARDHAIPTLLEMCQIVPAERIDDAGILGGAALAWQAVGGG